MAHPQVGTPLHRGERDALPDRDSVMHLRRRLVAEALAVASSSTAAGLVYGVLARAAGLSLLETCAMSVFVLAGSAQFAAVGLLAQGAAWGAVIGSAAALNARHLVYSAAIRPWLATRSLGTRAAAAYMLTDETFALSLAHFSRVRRTDLVGYWIAGLVPLAWVLTSPIGYLAAGLLADPAQVGLNAIFPIAMGGLAVGFLRDPRARVAASAACVTGVGGALLLPYPLALILAIVFGVAVASVWPMALTEQTHVA
jgi:predicted branched-subunit amino acid permease